MFGYWKSGRAIANNFQPSNISPVCDSAIAIESIVVFWFCIWHWNNVPDMPGIISVDVSFLRWVSWNLSWNVWPMVTIDIIWLYHESISQKQNVNARWDLTKQWARLNGKNLFCLVRIRSLSWQLIESWMAGWWFQPNIWDDDIPNWMEKCSNSSNNLVLKVSWNQRSKVIMAM